jgi:transposase
MDKRPEVERLSEPEKDALMATLWAELQRLNARLAALEATPREPRKDAHHARVPPSQTPKATLPRGPGRRLRREARVGRAGGGRPLHPDPAPGVIAQAKTCPHGGGGVPAHAQHPHAVDDTIEWPSVKPIITRVEQHGGPCPHGGQTSVAPVPVGMEPGTPVGASIEGLATSLRYTPAIRDERLAALLAQVAGVPISAGALAHLFQRVQSRLDDRGAEILTRRRSSRLIGSDETGARVNGRTPWAWVVQNAAVCVPVIRPSRGHEVIQDTLDDHRPIIGGSALDSAHKNHPAEPWQVCLAHQWRDGQFALETGDTVCAPRMKAVRRRAVAMHKRRDTLAASTLYQYRCDLQRRVDRCLASQPTTPHGRRLQKRYTKMRDHLCLLLEDASSPPTHHASEHASRMRTVFRKVTHGCRSQWGRDLCAAVRSVVNTGQRHGLSAYQAIQKARSPLDSLFEPG